MSADYEQYCRNYDEEMAAAQASHDAIEAPDPGTAQGHAAEYAREQRWADLEREISDFASKEPEGFAAVLRAVARVMSDQRSLLL